MVLNSSKLLSEEYLVKDAETIHGGSNKSALFSTLVPNVSHSNGSSGLGFSDESSTFFSQTSLKRSFWISKFGCRWTHHLISNGRLEFIGLQLKGMKLEIGWSPDLHNFHCLYHAVVQMLVDSRQILGLSFHPPEPGNGLQRVAKQLLLQQRPLVSPTRKTGSPAAVADEEDRNEETGAASGARSKLLS
jgi:hypothetical protein